MRLLYILLCGFGLVFTACERPVQTSLLPTTAPSAIPESLYSEVAQVACHNCYELTYASDLSEVLNHTKVLEIDFYDQTRLWLGGSEANHWFVRHNVISGNKNNCKLYQGNNDLEACLQEIKTWSDDHPGHDPITVYLDKKQGWPAPGKGRSPKDLDALLLKVMKDKIFKPSDILQEQASLRRAVQQRGWPSMQAMRGKILFVLTGGHPFQPNKTQHSYLKGRENEALIFVAPNTHGLSDITSIPKRFDAQTAEWVVFYNAKHKASNREWLSSLKPLNYIARIWGGDSTDFCQQVAEGIHHVAYYDYERQRCGAQQVLFD